MADYNSSGDSRTMVPTVCLTNIPRKTGCSGTASTLPSVIQKLRGEHATVPQQMSKSFAKMKWFSKADTVGLLLIALALFAAPKVAFTQLDEHTSRTHAANRNVR